MRIYAVGDIHGCAAELDRLLARIADDARHGPAQQRLVYVGDYIDRGPDSRAVIERLLASPAGFTSSYLRGNHDQALLDFLKDPAIFRSWRDFGARETLMSYGVVPPRFDDEAEFALARDRLRQAMPPQHVAWLEGLEYSVQIGDYYFAHAGVRPGVALERQSPEDLLWIRDEFLMSSADHGAVVVHGHTPTDEPERRLNRIGVDTGAYATGRLTAAVLEATECRFLSS